MAKKVSFEFRIIVREGSQEDGIVKVRKGRKVVAVLGLQRFRELIQMAEQIDQTGPLGSCTPL